MKKVLGIGIILFIMLVGCNDDSGNEEVEASSATDDIEKVTSEQEESEPFVDYEGLPFDVNDVEEDYNSLSSEATTTMIDFNEKTINLADGNLAEATTLLNALNLNYGDGQVESITDELAKGLDEDSFFINDYVVDDAQIHIAAVDASFITVKITNAEDVLDNE